MGAEFPGAMWIFFLNKTKLPTLTQPTGNVLGVVSAVSGLTASAVWGAVAISRSQVWAVCAVKMDL